ncbi:hypothetical protein ANN_26046 [Periplaneta americana]|uniref:Reverse transcriptase domain-containing protein n=1 Tax=Periplaneta americana TaxID=6978 RepID=A0ABQ8S5D6_PERAM|nr:hypothetical protein ANN_26046 [Periplaneta americana]
MKRLEQYIDNSINDLEEKVAKFSMAMFTTHTQPYKRLQHENCQPGSSQVLKKNVMHQFINNQITLHPFRKMTSLAEHTGLNDNSDLTLRWTQDYGQCHINNPDSIDNGITPQIVQLIKTKRRAHRLYMRQHTDDNRRLYRSLQQDVKDAIRRYNTYCWTEITRKLDNTRKRRPYEILDITKETQGRLQLHIDDAELIRNTQAGFRPHINIVDQLLKILTHIELAREQGQTAAIVALDLQRAFDTVWHDGLRYKLTDIRLPPQIIRWISDLLNNRTAQVKINHQLSEHLTINRVEDTQLKGLAATERRLLRWALHLPNSRTVYALSKIKPIAEYIRQINIKYVALAIDRPFNQELFQNPPPFPNLTVNHLLEIFNDFLLQQPSELSPSQETTAMSSANGAEPPPHQPAANQGRLWTPLDQQRRRGRRSVLARQDQLRRRPDQPNEPQGHHYRPTVPYRPPTNLSPSGPLTNPTVLSLSRPTAKFTSKLPPTTFGRDAVYETPPNATERPPWQMPDDPPPPASGPRPTSRGTRPSEGPSDFDLGSDSSLSEGEQTNTTGDTTLDTERDNAPWKVTKYRKVKPAAPGSIPVATQAPTPTPKAPTPLPSSSSAIGPSLPTTSQSDRPIVQVKITRHTTDYNPLFIRRLIQTNNLDIEQPRQYWAYSSLTTTLTFTTLRDAEHFVQTIPATTFGPSAELHIQSPMTTQRPIRQNKELSVVMKNVGTQFLWTTLDNYSARSIRESSDWTASQRQEAILRHNLYESR